MSINVLSNVALIFNVCEKKPKNTEVIGTKTGAVPWPMTLVFPELKKHSHSLIASHCSSPPLIVPPSFESLRRQRPRPRPRSFVKDFFQEI